jgi:hypothetical protein
MPKSTTFSNDILALILNATAIADLAENDTSSPLATLYLSLHTADPGVGGSPTTNETAYTNYVRVGVARDNTGWQGASAAWDNEALVQFAQCGASGATITHVAIGTTAAGAGKVLYAGELDDPVAVSLNIQPQFAAGALDVVEA